VVADPQALSRTGAAISDLRSSITVGAVDPTLLEDEVIGHAGLARALREFAAQWDQRLGEFGEHLDALGETVRQAGRGYGDTDTSSAQRLAGLGTDLGSMGGADHGRWP
jgi:hypothetical protein